MFEQKYEKYQSFLPEKFRVLEVKFSIYLNRHVFVMMKHRSHEPNFSSNLGPSVSINTLKVDPKCVVSKQNFFFNYKEK